MMIQKLEKERITKQKLKPITVTIDPLHCFRCGSYWYPLVRNGKLEIPQRCTNKACNSPYYKTPVSKKSGPKYSVKE